MAGSYNHVVLVGRVTADPELKQTPQGVNVTSFRLAVDRVLNNRETPDKQTYFFGVSVWRQRAERAAEFLQKGRLVLVSGRLQVREWTDRDGNKRTNIDVTADDFQMLDSRGAGGDAATRAMAPAASGGGNLPDFEYNEATDEEVPF